MNGDFRDGFADLMSEIEVPHLTVSGEVPAWLTGSFLRNGPAHFIVGGLRNNHWFDGLAMLHRFGFEAGQVSYRNRFLASENYVRVRATDKRNYDQFATNPPRYLWQKIIDTLYFPLQFGNNQLVNIGRLGDSWLALGETVIQLAIDPETLATQGPFKWRDWMLSMITSAHPVRDDRRRTVFNCDSLVLPFLSRYKLWRLDDGSRRRRVIASLPVARPGYMHSFGASENYLILTDMPIRVNPWAMFFGAFTGVPFIENFHWSGEDVKFTVIAKDSGEVTGTFQAPAFFAFHHVNAVEDGEGAISLDIVTYPDMEIIKRTYFKALLGADGGTLPASHLVRYRVPIRGEGALMPPERLAAPAFEMPVWHPDLQGKPYRFVYGYGFDAPGDFNDRLFKIDLAAPADDAVRRWHAPGCYPSEPMFVPRPGGAQEDDGVILSVVFDAGAGHSFLVVIDAGSFTEVARAAVPHAIPYGLHGAFMGREGTA
jgi:carotenoid cleavage dioxygenase-like enzyme